MRPREIDFTNYATHYIDLSDGELLLEGPELEARLGENRESNSIYELGALLRAPTEDVPILPRESKRGYWTEEKAKIFGRWAVAILPQAEVNKSNISVQVFRNAGRLGIGPTYTAIPRLFGKYTEFYKEIGADTTRPRQFDDWDIDDFVNYFKVLTRKNQLHYMRVQQISLTDKTKPSYDHIKRRYAAIGGFRKIAELAGRPNVKDWDRDDFVAWGVGFMQANDGLLPTSRMLKFLSHKRQGPSPTAAVNMFDHKYANFQKAVIKEYESISSEKDCETLQKVSFLKKQLTTGKVPADLLQTNEKMSGLGDASTREDSIDEQIGKIGVTEAVARHAKYSVLRYIVREMSEPVKLKIALGEGENKGFIRAIRKHHDISGGEIEHAALILQLFDDIWPANEHLTLLKLGSEYDKFKWKVAASKA